MTQNKELAKDQQKNDLVNSVLTRVNELQKSGGINIPSDYSAANALQAAWLILNEIPEKGGEPLINKCTKTSISKALFEMVSIGLNPMKNQCAFVPRGQVLTLQREYQGNIAIAKRVGGLKDINAIAVHAEDVFSFGVDVESGTYKITKHETTLKSLDSAVVGAYAVVELVTGEKYAVIMTMEQIRKAWEQGSLKGAGPAHKNFTDEMAKKTVINRACKPLINSSNDMDLFISERKEDDVQEAVFEEIEENANTGDVITIEEVAAEVVEENPGF